MLSHLVRGQWRGEDVISPAGAQGLVKTLSHLVRGQGPGDDVISPGERLEAW